MVRHALVFVSGFGLTFVILFGLPTTLLGGFLAAQRGWIAALGGFLLIVLGVQMTGALRAAARLSAARGRWRAPGAVLAACSRALDALLLPERRFHPNVGPSPGYVRSFFVGVTFAAGWTPCIGPLLGLVLTLAAVQPFQAMPLLLAYATGLAIPFLLSAVALRSAVGRLKGLHRCLPMAERVSGALLFVFGLVLVQGSLARLNLLFGAPEWLAAFEALLAGDVSAITLPLAALAGLLSFLSPCVLPLVPIYLSYLSGTALSSAPAAAAVQGSARVV